MQAQIEPHFLFNTLANVQALVAEGSPRAPAVLQSLIAYLRAAMPRLHQARPTLGDRPAASGGMHLWVQDSGVGMSPQAEPGLGLTNLRSRLRGVFGEAADMQLSEVAPQGLRVDLHLPAKGDR